MTVKQELEREYRYIEIMEFSWILRQAGQIVWRYYMESMDIREENQL